MVSMAVPLLNDLPRVMLVRLMLTGRNDLGRRK